MEREHGFYSHYFKDYMEIPIEGQNGKFRRVYVGDYYRQDLSKKHFFLLRLVYVFAFALSAALYVCAGLRDLMGSLSLLVAVPTGASLVFFLLTAVALGFYVFTDRDMTVGEYTETSRFLLRYSKWTAAALSLTGLAVLACALLYRGGWVDALINAGLFFASAAAMLALYLTERRVPYRITPGQHSAAGGGFLI